MTGPLLPSPESYTRAAWVLDVDPLLLESLAEVERDGREALDDSGRPVILFEPHLFSRFTGGKHDGAAAPGVRAKYATISYPRWQQGIYGSHNEQHNKLGAAARMNRDAALRATSWGLFQVLGDNWKQSGASSLQDFVNRMYAGADSQLRCLVSFILRDTRLVSALRTQDYATFSRIYNGPSYERTKHHVKIAEVYDRLRQERA